MNDPNEITFYEYPDLRVLKPQEGFPIPALLCGYEGCLEPITHLIHTKIGQKGTWVCTKHAHETELELRITYEVRAANYYRKERQAKKAKEWLRRQPSAN